MSDGAALFVIEASQNDADDINNLPDNKTAAGQKLNNTGNDFAGIDAVNAAEAAKNEKGKQQGCESGTRGL